MRFPRALHLQLRLRGWQKAVPRAALGTQLLERSVGRPMTQDACCMIIVDCCGLLWSQKLREKWNQTREKGACVFLSKGGAEAPWSGGGRQSGHAMTIRVTSPSTAFGAEGSSKSRRHMASTVIGKQVCTSNKEPLLDSGVRHLSPPTDLLRTHAPASRSFQSRGGTSSRSPLGAVSSPPRPVAKAVSAGGRQRPDRRRPQRVHERLAELVDRHRRGHAAAGGRTGGRGPRYPRRATTQKGAQDTTVPGRAGGKQRSYVA